MAMSASGILYRSEDIVVVVVFYRDGRGSDLKNKSPKISEFYILNNK